MADPAAPQTPAPEPSFWRRLAHAAWLNDAEADKVDQAANAAGAWLHEVPLWRRAAQFAGVDDEIDAMTDAAHRAGAWIQSKLPQPTPEGKARLDAMERQVREMEAQRAQQRQETWDAVAGPVQRFFSSEPVRAFGHYLHDQYAPLWTPAPETQALADLARTKLAEHSDAMRQAMDQDAIPAPLRMVAAVQNDWIPSALISQAEDASTPFGAAMNLDLPLSEAAKIAALAHAGGGVAHLAGLPYLNATGRRAIDEARQFLEHETMRLGGPVSQAELQRVLATVPIDYAHRVTKGMEVTDPLHTMERILVPRPGGGYDFAPAVSARTHAMTDIGAALPRQANWGPATDPALLPAFNNDRRAAELFGRFFSSLSPRTSVAKNALENLNVWRDFLRAPGRPFTDERLRSLGVGNVRSKIDNLTRAILGLDPSGEKVDLFTDFMAGRTPLPVPDVHGLYGIGSRHGAIDDVLPELRRLVEAHEGIPGRRGGLTNKDYVRRLTDAYARDLQNWGPGQGMGPLFGTHWEGVRGQKGLPFQGGMIDIYRDYGLDQPGAMFDDRLLSEAIRNWGGR